MSTQAITICTSGSTTAGAVSRVTLVSQAVTGPAGASGTGGDMMKADNLSGLANYATARTNLGLGTAATTDATAYATAAQGTTADAALKPANNLSDVALASTARTNLGLGTAATTASTAYATAAQGTTADAALPRTAAGASVTNLGSVTSNCETANVVTTKTVDLSTYNAVDYTMTGNTTFTFSNWATSGKMGMFTMILRGAFTPTLPAAVKWNGGAAATYTTPAMYVFTSIDAGTTVLSTQIGKAFA